MRATLLCGKKRWLRGPATNVISLFLEPPTCPPDGTVERVQFVGSHPLVEILYVRETLSNAPFLTTAVRELIKPSS